MKIDDDNKEENEVSPEEYQMKALECEIRCREEIEWITDALEESFKKSAEHGIDDSVTLFHSAQVMADQTARDMLYKAPIGGLLGKIYHMLLIVIDDNRKLSEGINE